MRSLDDGMAGDELSTRRARAIHYAGPARDAPFVAVSCAAIPARLLEAELFGYERGAFTDARHTKQGLLELTRDGTLFLDEVSNLPFDLQPKLLRALEERRVRRVGGFEEIEIRCRVTTATHVALERLVEEGTFRDDLFYRLNVLRVAIPPLRDHRPPSPTTTPCTETEAETVIRVPPEGRSLRSVEAELVELTLGMTGGNKSAAARVLGISRPTLHRKVTEYGLA